MRANQRKFITEQPLFLTAGSLAMNPYLAMPVCSAFSAALGIVINATVLCEAKIRQKMLAL